MRLASHQEQLIEELKGPIELPWTFAKIMSSGSRRTYVDNVGHGAPPGDEPQEEQPRRRHLEKGPPRYETVEREAKRAQVEARSRKRTGDDGADLDEQQSEAVEAVEVCHQATEIEVSLPTSNRGVKKFIQNPVAYVCSQIRKRTVEVRLKDLTPSELEEFKKAKDKEVNNFIAAECFELIKDRKPEELEVMGMRWLLTWKPTEDGGKKAKARAIVLGYQDPEYKERDTSAPTPSKAGRQLFLQMCSWKQFQLAKGDVSGAFLQGMKVQEEMFCRPVDEICTAMGAEPGTAMAMRKVAYGLVQAPLQWYKSICSCLKELGYVRLRGEPCCWIYLHKTEVVSAIHGHVDDFLFGGRETCPIHKSLMTRIQERFEWGEWQVGEFVQCGIHMKQLPGFSIELDQTKFIEDLEEIHFTREKSRNPELPTSDGEKTAMRGVLGSLAWVCGQTCFMYAVDSNMMISRIKDSKIADILELKQIVRSLKKWKYTKVKLHAHPQEEPLLMEDNVTPVFWRSGKLERTPRISMTSLASPWW